MCTRIVCFILCCLIFFQQISTPAWSEDKYDAVDKHLYILPHFKNLALADKTLDFIQCIFEKANIYVEVVSQDKNLMPILFLDEVDDQIQAKIKRRKTLIDLGSFSPQALGHELCENFLEALLQKPKDLQQLHENMFDSSKSDQSLSNTKYESPKGDSFLKKYWPYMAVVAAATAGFLIFRASDKQYTTEYRTNGLAIK